MVAPFRWQLQSSPVQANKMPTTNYFPAMASSPQHEAATSRENVKLEVASSPVDSFTATSPISHNESGDAHIHRSQRAHKPAQARPQPRVETAASARSQLRVGHASSLLHKAHAPASRFGHRDMDLEAGVRFGSLCAEARPSTGSLRCPIAADVTDELVAAAANISEAEPSAPLCIFTSLTEAYVEGHVNFMRSVLQTTPSFTSTPPPLYVLDQAVTAESRQRVENSYPFVRWVKPRGQAKDSRVVTKFALNKEKTALFGLRADCGSVLKIDTGDMLVLADLKELLEIQPGTKVLAAQALGQTTGKINGGLMLFGRFWLHPATERALEARAALESREQALFGGFFADSMGLLPKRYNVEQRFWDDAHRAWRAAQLAKKGQESIPTLEQTAVVHYVGRDKPWMRYDQIGRNIDDQATMCRRLREHDDPTCRRYLAVQGMWWKQFGSGACIIVGDSAAGLGQGFVIESFEWVLRMHRPKLHQRDVGNLSVGERCGSAKLCTAAATTLGCTPLTVGHESGFLNTTRSLLDVFQHKLGIFGGPPIA